MSFNRAVLRAAIKQALLNQTCAQGRVFDSRIDELPTDNVNNVLPAITVYTDMDMSKNTNMGGARPINRRTVDVMLELTLMQYVERESGVPDILIPETDAEAECLLDLFESEVKFRLQGPHAGATLLHQVVKGWEEWTSIPGRWGEGNNKISARTIIGKCWIADDCGPIWDGVRRTTRANPLAAINYLSPFFERVAAAPQFESLRGMLSEILGTDELPEVHHLNTFNLVLDVAPPDGVIDPDRPHKVEALVELEP